MAGQSSRAWWQGEIALVIATVLFLCVSASSAQATTVNSYGGLPVGKVRPEFISFGIDASQLTERSDGQPFDFTRPALKKLAAELAPAFIRYSGTKVETTYYDDTNSLGDHAPGKELGASEPGHYDYVLSRDEWEAALDFADETGLKVMAATSAGPGPRNPDMSWNPDNARALIERAIDQGHPPAAIMLGNEPNITYYGSGMPFSYDAADYAADVDDFLSLKNELLPQTTFVGPGPFFSTGTERPLNGGPLGPDVSAIMALAGGRYDAVSYHQYPAFGDSPKCAAIMPHLPADTLSAEFLDTPKGAYEYMAGLRDENAPGKPLWIDESGNTACGGVEGYSDKFISTFYYLNSLGYLAQRGVEVVTRWTLSGPQPYALIDDQTLEPRADYWAAVLWHRLMGRQVLKPSVEAPDPALRVYSQCLPDTVGGVTTLLLNTSRTDSRTVTFDGPGLTAAEQYVVTGALDGDQVSLNGKVLAAAADGSIPTIDGVPIPGGQVTVPAASYAFVTVPAAEATGCGAPHPDPGVKVVLTAPKQSLRRILRTGRIRAFCHPDLASVCRVRATLPRRQAKRLGLKVDRETKRLPLGFATAEVRHPAKKAVSLKVKPKALEALRKAPHRFKPAIRLEAIAVAAGIAFGGHDSLRLRLRR